jgi:hypothetical protein
MRHATIQDAFDAASGVARQGLGFLTKEKEYELDTALFQQSIELEKTQKELLADYTRIDEGSGENVFQQNPEAYQKHVQERLAEWWKNAEAAGNGSRYFLDRLGRMGLQGSEDMRQRVAALADETSRQRAAIGHAKAYAAIDNAGWDIQKTLEAKMAELERYNGINALGPVEKHKERALVFNSIFEQALKNVNTGGMTVEQALAAIDGIPESLEGFAAGYLAEGESLDSFLNNKQELLAEAKSAARMVIWDREYGDLYARSQEAERIARDAVRAGDYSLLRYAQGLWREGSQDRETALGETYKENGQFNPKDRSKIAGLFPVVPGLFDDASAGGSGGSGSGKAGDAGPKAKEILQSLRDYHISNIAEGRGNIEEEKAAFRQACGELAGQLPGIGTIDELERQYPKETNFFGMFADAKKLLLERDPGYKTAMDSVEALVAGWANETKDPLEKALRKWQGERIGIFLFDKILDASGPARISPDAMQREALSLAGLLVAGEVSFMRETAGNSRRFTVGADNDKDFGKATWEIAQHPEARFVVQGKAYAFGDAQYMKDYEESALDKFRTITGIPLASLKIGHSKEGMHDEAAELNIIVSGMGEKNGTYRFAADKNGNYWIERQEGGEWVREDNYAITAKEARGREWDRQREEHAAAQARAEAEAGRRGMNATFEMIRREDDRMRRKALAGALQNTVGPDEFWKAGIHPNSAETVTEIPAKEWDRILNAMAAGDRERQEREWRQMGIKRGSSK